ncbi:MAG: recombinase family protein [Clostridiales bacterium]|nr:recombinase family protein [Clostridiales bacterium]
MLHSLAAQVDHYSTYIRHHHGWEYVGVYADEAKTGTRGSQENFQRMRNTPPDRGAAERTVLGSPWGVSFRPGRRHRPAPLCPANAHGHGLH